MMKNKYYLKLKKFKNKFSNISDLDYVFKILIIDVLKITPNNFYTHNFKINLFFYIKVKFKLYQFIYFKKPLAYLIKKKNF